MKTQNFYLPIFFIQTAGKKLLQASKKSLSRGKALKTNFKDLEFQENSGYKKIIKWLMKNLH